MIEPDRIKTDYSKIVSFVEELETGKYQIPTFQRDVAWDRENIKKLWDSIYKFYPIGSLLIWKTETALKRHRAIGGRTLNEPGGSTFRYILDGQQRSTSIFLSLKGTKGDIASEEDFDPLLYVDLTWEPHEDDETGYRSLFLFWDEIDDRGGTHKKNAGRKKRFDDGLIVPLYDVYGSTQEIEERLDKAGYKYGEPPRKNLRVLDQVIKNYVLSIIELRGIEVREVCDIFERVNREGQPLDVVDIVVAKTYRNPSESDLGFYLRDLFDDLRASLDGSQYRNLSDFVVLQMIASLLMRNEESKVKNITNTYLPRMESRELEEIWPHAKTAIIDVIRFFEQRLHLPGPKLVPYGYMYPALANYFFENAHVSLEIPKRWFWFKAFSTVDFDSTTKLKEEIDFFGAAKSSGRAEWTTLVLDKQILRAQSYLARGAKSRAILALLAYQRPCEFRDPDRDVLQTVYLQLTDRPNLHHFFPIAHLAKYQEQKNTMNDPNSLVNIVFLPQIENLQIGAESPLNYLKIYRDETPSFHEVLRRHLIPLEILDWLDDESLRWADFDRFVDLRTDLMVNAIRSLLPDVSVRVVDTAAGEEV